MPKGLPQNLGTWMAQVERKLDNLSSGNRLDHASLDGTTLYLKGDGELGRIGRQPDGSNGVHIAKVQPPPQLTAAILTVGQQAGTCLVEWDGGTFDGRRMPLIHGHTEVWAELVGEDWSPTVAPGDAAKRVGTIRDRTGGEVVVALPQAGVWAVWLRAMGADRETAGPWSPVAQVEIVPLVDTDAIEAELEDARQQIEDADQRLTEGQGELDGKLDELDERVGPGVDGTSSLTQALTTGLDDVYREAQQYAESQADNAVNQAAANAQSEYDRLQEIAERALSRAGDNVLEDPSFETDFHFNGWTSSWFSASPSPLARTGDQAMAINRAAGGTVATTTSLGTADVEVDDSWRLSVWYKTPDEANLGFNTGTALRIRDAANNNILAQSETFMVSEEYSRAVVTATIPEGVESITASLLMSFTTGTLIIDDIAFQEVGAAAEALRLAEVARQQAEAAHIAAGNAVDTAANAYDAATSKSTVHWSLSAPSGTADNTDDVWWQYELRNGRRVVIGQWFWDNGVWRETEIAEEWLPQVNIGTGTYGDLHGDRLTANTVHANKMLVGPRNIITDPSFAEVNTGSIEDGWGSYTGGWETASVSWSDRPLARVTVEATSEDELKVLHYGGSSASNASIPCEPGETFKARFQVVRYVGGSSDDDYRAHFRWVDAEGNGIAWSASNFASVGNQGWHEFEATAPEGAAWFYFRFAKYGVVAASRGVGNVSIQKMTDTDLLVDGAVKSRTVDTEEFFAAEAVIQKIWTDIVRSRLIESQGIITEDMIATGAITTPKLTVTEEMVAQIASFIRVEAGSLASNDIEAMRIVSSLIEATTYLIHNANGDVSVRLDGMNNFLRGSIHAGVSENSEIHLDYGTITLSTGWEDAENPGEITEQIDAPYIQFNQDRGDQVITPRIWVHDDGQMRISPGRTTAQDPHRGRLQIHGDVQSNRFIGNRADVRDVNLNTGSTSQPGGVHASGSEPGRVRFRGRLVNQRNSADTFTVGNTSSSYDVSPGGSWRAGVAYYTPAPTGTVYPFINFHIDAWTSDNYNIVSGATSSRTAAGFTWNVGHIRGGNTATFWVQHFAVWN